MTIPTLSTPRLTLRPFEAEDAEPLHRILLQENILQYFPPSTPPTLEKAQRIIDHQLTHWADHGLGWWAVQLREGDDLIGWNGLQYLPETGEVEIGYLLSKDAWGRGYATEGARAGLQFGFETLGLTTIIGLVHRDNVASQRVLLKCGMTFLAESEYFGMILRKYTIDCRSAF
jgi:[ribosomal protein S5]-alanine N-acetyltransferase